MRGMDRETGRNIDGLTHLRQSIVDILTTPIGTRVMRRDYGSRLPDLLGAPAGADLLVEVTAASAGALRRWEPRFKLTGVRLDGTTPGRLVIDLIGQYRPDGRDITLDGLVIT